MSHKDIKSVVNERVNVCDYKAMEWREVFFPYTLFCIKPGGHHAVAWKPNLRAILAPLCWIK